MTGGEILGWALLAVVMCYIITMTIALEAERRERKRSIALGLYHDFESDGPMYFKCTACGGRYFAGPPDAFNVPITCPTKRQKEHSNEQTR